MLKPIAYYTLTFLSISIFTSNIQAAGFSLNEYPGGTSLGRAGAGDAAVAEDAITAFTNPAGLTDIKKSQLLMTGQVFITSAKMTNQGSRDVLGNSMRGGSGGDAGAITPIPALYYAHPVTDKLALGWSINTPFGLGTEYNSDWVGRYQTIKGLLKTININPSVGYKLNEVLSIGGGVSLQYIDAEMSNALDLGTVCFGAVSPQACGQAGLTPQGADGRLKIKASDWSWGYNLGTLWKLTDKTRLGFHYRSAVKQNLKGDASFSIPAAANILQPAFTNTQATIPMTLPERLSLSLVHQWNERLAIMGDFSYTRWSRNNEIAISYDNPAQPKTVITKAWHDSKRVAVGLDYGHASGWHFQSGLAFDQSPIPSDRFDPLVPIADMWWLSAGASHKWSDKLSFNIGYAHAFIKNHDIQVVGGFGDTLKGSYKAGTDIINAQLQWRF